MRTSRFNEGQIIAVFARAGDWERGGVRSLRVAGRRRAWRAEQKAAIVAESFEDRVLVSAGGAPLDAEMIYLR